MNSELSPEIQRILALPVDEAARALLGCELICNLETGQAVRLRIVETEAYDQEDEASHAFGGERKRNATMFGPAGRLYVYFTYGLHHCCNIVTGQPGYGSGVLIRALEPLDSHQLLEARRGVSGVNITNGPGKLCQALGIDLNMNGHDLARQPLRLLYAPLIDGEEISSSPRIGISKARDIHRRYFIAGNPYVSRR